MAVGVCQRDEKEHRASGEQGLDFICIFLSVPRELGIFSHQIDPFLPPVLSFSSSSFTYMMFNANLFVSATFLSLTSDTHFLFT